MTKQSYGHYEVEAVLGQGAMGTVYLARDQHIGRRVALKTIQLTNRQLEDSTGDTDFLARLQREAEICGGMNHPNLVTLYEAGYENDRISYLAIEYIDGESLQALLKKEGRLPIDQSLFIAEEVLKGLAFAHSQGVIHRDIKPANILLSADGAVKIADFGIARPVASNLTRVGVLMGTPHYMAPEQVRGEEVTAQTDLFSLGVMLFQMITGKKPFSGPDVASILYNIVNDPSPVVLDLRPEVPVPVAHFIERMMARDPRKRYASATDAMKELHRLRDLDAATMALTESSPSFQAKTEADVPTLPSFLVRLRGRVPARVFWSTAMSLGGLILISILLIAGRIDSSPSVDLSDQKLREFQDKKRMLEGAEALYRSGNYEASARHYEEYLRRYPASPAAREGLRRARDAQREFEIVEQATATDTAGSKQGRKKKKEEDWMLKQIKGVAKRISGSR